ncbi:MAG: hypothetical protein KA715_00795 [Xanthomonadaceae bacterium]|nr:hypothetical protein [Xanthomonadaceae bacterium]
MKTIIALLGLLSFNSSVQAQEQNFRLIDKQGLLPKIEAFLGTQNFDTAFKKGDSMTLEMMGSTTATGKVQKVKKNFVVITGQKKKKFTRKEFDQFKGNMMLITLNDSNSKQEINGQVTKNTYELEKIAHTKFELDNGQNIDALIITLVIPGGNFGGFFDLSTRVEFILGKGVPSVSQLLSLEWDGQNLFRLVSYSAKR